MQKKDDDNEDDDDYYYDVDYDDDDSVVIREVEDHSNLLMGNLIDNIIFVRTVGRHCCYCYYCKCYYY